MSDHRVEQASQPGPQVRLKAWLDSLLQDLRYAARMLRKAAGFTAIAVLTLALGVGASTAVFSVVDAVLLRPLPYRDAGRILFLYGKALATGNFEQWRAQSQSYERFAAMSVQGAKLTGLSHAERVGTAEVSADFFTILGIQPQFGRLLLPDDFQGAGGHVAVVSHRFWQTSLNSDPQSVGHTLRLDDSAFTVIGVLPQEVGPLPYRDIDVWLPLLPGRSKNAVALAQLKPGISLETARAESQAIAERLADNATRRWHEPLVQVLRLKDHIVDNSALTLWLLATAIGVILLIVCINVANLQLVRLAGRQGEVAIRSALGATRARLVSQLLAEGLLLAALGGASGVLFSHWLTRTLIATVPYYVPRLDQAKIGIAALVFSFLISAAAVLFFSLLPAFAALKTDLALKLKQAAGRATAGGRLHRALVISEIALATMVLISAALLVETFLALQPSHPGFDPRDRLTMRVEMAHSSGQRIGALTQVAEHIGAIPGVRAVATVSDLPLTGSSFVPDISIGGHVVAGIGQGTMVHYRTCSPNFLEVMAMPLVDGRDFSSEDDERAPAVAIINQTMARLFWPNQRPIGQELTVDVPDRPLKATVVGVVHDARLFSHVTAASPEMYVPFRQDPLGSMTLVIHTSFDPIQLAPAARDAVHAVDRDLVISSVQTMQQIVYRSVAEPRFAARLFAMIAGLALFLAMIGIYGVTSYGVAQRTREIGIRMALGAQATNVLRKIIGEGLVLAGAGTLLGTAVALALSRFLRSLLFEVKPTDPLAYAVVALLFAIVSLAACWLPARRAAQVDPMIALRHE